MSANIENTNRSSLFDCHLHSCFSSDSKAAPRDVIRTAAGKLSGICVTEHNDFDYPPEDGKTVFALDLDRYLNTYEALRPSLPENFTLLLGVEQGLQKSVAERVNAYDPDGRLDFIIGSSHLVRGNDPYYPSFWEGRSVSDALGEYFDSILENLSCCRNFDVYGHLDYITRYIPNRTAEFRLPDSCTDQIDVILRKLIGLNVMDTGVFLFLASMGYIEGRKAPIIVNGVQSTEAYINPLPASLVLTGIVVSVSVTAIMLSLTVRLYMRYHTLNLEDQ